MQRPAGKRIIPVRHSSSVKGMGEHEQACFWEEEIMGFIIGLLGVGLSVFAYALILESWSSRKLEARIKQEVYRANAWDDKIN